MGASVVYTIALSGEDKLKVEFKKNRGRISFFIVQYYGLIGGRWRTIMRIDTCHGYPHKHTYYLRRRQLNIALGTKEDNNRVLTESLRFVKKNFQKIKENFLIRN